MNTIFDDLISSVDFNNLSDVIDKFIKEYKENECSTKKKCSYTDKSNTEHPIEKTGYSNAGDKCNISKPNATSATTIKEPIKSKYPFDLAKDIVALSNNEFSLNLHAKDLTLSDRLELNFSHILGDIYTTGITENQLLTILLYRYRNNKEKSDLIMKLLRG